MSVIKKETKTEDKTHTTMYTYFIYEKETKTWKEATEAEYKAWDGKKSKTV